MTEWTPEESESLKKLPREADPAPELRDRVISALRSEGMLRSPRPWWPVAAAIAIGVAGFVVGFGAARVSAASPQASHVLLLRESPQQLSGVDAERQVAEYIAWAREARRKGVLVGGEKLEDRGEVLSPGRVATEGFAKAGDIGGFFLIRAASDEAATQIAHSTPHLRYGGTIELRPISRLAPRATLSPPSGERQ